MMRHMWTWIFIVLGYIAVLFVFRLMGGIAAAGEAIAGWGSRSSARRRRGVEQRLGLSRSPTSG
jgi:hypothetical protein